MPSTRSPARSRTDAPLWNTTSPKTLPRWPGPRAWVRGSSASFSSPSRREPVALGPEPGRAAVARGVVDHNDFGALRGIPLDGRHDVGQQRAAVPIDDHYGHTRPDAESSRQAEADGGHAPENPEQEIPRPVEDGVVEDGSRPGSGVGVAPAQAPGRLAARAPDAPTGPDRGRVAPALDAARRHMSIVADW